MVVPFYTFQLNDLQNFENRWRTCSDFAGELKAEFDALYLADRTQSCRMISIATHDRVAHVRSRVRVLDDFGVSPTRNVTRGFVFMKKGDEIARFAFSNPLTIREDGI